MPYLISDVLIEGYLFDAIGQRNHYDHRCAKYKIVISRKAVFLNA